MNRLGRNITGFGIGAGLTTLLLLPVYNRVARYAEEQRNPPVSVLFQRLENHPPLPMLMRCEDSSLNERFAIVVSRPSPEKDTVSFFQGEPPAQEMTRNGGMMPQHLPAAVLHGDMTPQRMQEEIVKFCGTENPAKPEQSNTVAGISREM